MFIAAMSTIAKLWKETRCPSTDEWIKKMWYVYIYTYTHTHTHILTKANGEIERKYEFEKKQCKISHD